MKFLSPINVDGYVAADHLKLSQTTAESVNIAEIVWNAVDGTFDMGLLNGVTLQSGQEMHFYGKASGAIANGQAVMFAGSEGDHILMAVAEQGTINANPEYFIGVATQDFTNNQFGYVTVLGKVRNLNTTVYASAVLYYNSNPAPIGPGLLTAIQPEAPYAKISVAAVIRVHATQGILMVRPHIMPRIKDLQDVYAPSPSNNNGLFWNSATLRYETKSIPTVLGYTPQDAATAITTSNIGSQSVNYANNAGYASNAGTLDGLDSLYFYPASNPNGYISSYTETDPIYTASSWYSTANNASNWNTAYGWGNHASAGYVPQARTITINGVGYDLSANRSWTITATEVDTLQSVTARGATTNVGVGFNNYVNILGQNSIYWYNSSNTSYARTYFDGGTFNLDKSLWVTANIYGDVFYDRNNSAYYVDPAGNSSLYYASFANDVQMNGNYLRFDQSGTRSWNIRAASGNLNFNSGDGGGAYVFNGASSFSGNASWFGGYGSGSGPGLAFENQSTFARIVFWGLDFYEWDSGQIMTMNNGYVAANNSFRAPIFYDSNDSGFYLDPNSTTTSLVVAGAIKQNNTLARPCVQWGQSGNVTGALVIKLPGTSPGNYGMIHAVIDVYEYNSNNVCTITIGGHNWSSQWYNYGAEVVGNTNKQVRLGIKDGKYCIVLGDGSSTWEYGQVVLRKIQNGTYYSGVMDLGGAYSIGIESDSYSWISGNLNTFSSTNVTATSAAYAPIYYDNNNTGYYMDPNGTSAVNAISAAGYIYSSSYLESAGAIYGTIFYDNNNRSYYCDPHSTSFFAGLQANSNIQSPIFYDYNNTGYYLDPASSSNLLNVYVSNLTASSIVYSSATGGFASSTYAVGQRNPIWRFANADGYGLSYFQGTAGDASQDTIGFHFGTATAAGSQFKMRGDGVFFASNDIIAFSSSDKQLKDNIQPIKNALEKLKQIGGYTFDWNDKQGVHSGHDVGVIAQEIESVLPEVVTTRDTGFKAVKYEKIVPLLIEAIKEQQTQIEELKQLVNQLINK